MVEIIQTVEEIEVATRKSLSYQKELFPIEIIEFYPNDLGSADLKLIGHGRNGKDYAIKKVTDGDGMIPASEIFCYELARQLNIPTPDFDIVKLQNDELAFGSVWEGGVHQISNFNAVASLLGDGVIDGIKVKSLDKFFSKVYAFDLFINNVDRHWGNFIFRKSFQSVIALAFDYSRAWYEIQYNGLQALDKNCNTQKIINNVKDFDKFDTKQAEETLIEISKIEPSTIEKILSEMPNEWMTKLQIDTIITWWSSQEFKERLLILRKEVANVLV
jgi:hypothetical protein